MKRAIGFVLRLALIVAAGLDGWPAWAEGADVVLLNGRIVTLEGPVIL